MSKDIQTETAHPNDYDVYFVKEVQRNGSRGYQLYLNIGGDGEEAIFGLDFDENGKNKAWLDYWAMRLNRAFVNGWFGAKGLSSHPDAKYYEELNRLFDLMNK